MPLQITKLADALGAEVGGVDLSRPLVAATFAEIREAWLEHLVLRFRGQRLSDPQLIAFSRHFGELDPPGPNPYGKPFLPEYPEMNVISNIKVGGAPIGGLGDGEAIWHADMTYVESRRWARSCTRSRLPPSGGDTYWANMYLAYESAAGGAARSASRGASAVHDATYNSAGIMRKGYKDVTDPREAPGARHALVRTHPETGRKCLFLGRRRNSYIVGLRARARAKRCSTSCGRTRRSRDSPSASSGASATCRLGQPLHAAPARYLRPGGAPPHAPHADQGRRTR